MKIMHLFPHFSDEQYRLLLSKYKDETMIKAFLGAEISKAVIKEEDFKTIDLLNKEIKL